MHTNTLELPEGMYMRKCTVHSLQLNRWVSYSKHNFVKLQKLKCEYVTMPFVSTTTYQGGIFYNVKFFLHILILFRHCIHLHWFGWPLQI